MKKILYTILILLIGVFIGLGVGALAGMFFAQQHGQGEASHLPTPTFAPTNTPAPTATLAPTNTPVPTATPAPTNTPVPTATLAPTNTPIPTATLAPTNTPVPTATLTPTSTPLPTATPTPTQTPGSSISTSEDFYGALHVEGTHLAAEDGTLVQLRGISTHGLGWFPGYVNEDMIAQARQEWGCNVFRLAMYTAEYNGYCTSDSGQKENLKNIIDIGIQAAIEQEMYVIIDWHILSDSNPNTYKDEAKLFFAEMAQKYAEVPNVIYEICNEPNGGTGWSTIKQYALELIPVIREYAPEAVIIVGTPTWSQDVDVAANDPITEYDNIMYALHFYAATHQDNIRNKCTTAVAKGLPLFVTEYGICDASGSGAINETQANLWIDLLDGYGISHAMWNLSNKSETSAMIKSSCNKTSALAATDLSAAGTWFVTMMKEAGLGSEDWIMPEPEESGSNIGNDNSGNSGQNTSEALTVEDIFEVTDTVELNISGGWSTGNGQAVQLNVVIKNTKATEEVNWVRELKIKEGAKVTVSQCWCAKVVVEQNALIITPEDYNKTVPAGGSVSGIGIIVEVE